MHELNGDNIQKIRNDIKRSGIKSNLLKDELVDHLCCQIESEMSQGKDFEEAYKKMAATYTNKEISKTEQNISLFINFRSIITSGLLYLSLIAFIVSWTIHMTQADWMGLIAFLLISLAFLRHSVIFKHDTRLKNHRLFSILSGIVFIFFLTGSIFRFLWLNYGFPNPHVMPMLIFSWFLFSILAFLYYNHFKSTSHHSTENKKGRMPFRGMSAIHVLLATASMLTFFMPWLSRYIHVLAGIILGIDILFFIGIILYRSSGKAVIKTLVLSSFMMVFIYFPVQSVISPSGYTVQFQTITTEPIQQEELFLHINYFKHGKETLVLAKKNDSVFQSAPIKINGGGIEMACKITREKRNTYDVLYNQSLKSKKLKLNHNDTVFTIPYKPLKN